MSMNKNRVDTSIINNSGQGKSSVVPDIVAKKFNWGAFFLNWIWCLANEYFKGALIFFFLPLVNLIPFIGSFIALGLYIWLGINGNRIAWQQKRWDSVEHFHKVQKIWAIVGVIFGFIGLTLVIYSMLLPMLMLIPTSKAVEHSAYSAYSTESENYKYSTEVIKAKMNLSQGMQMRCLEDSVPSNFANGHEIAQWIAPAFKLDGEVIDIGGMGSFKLQNGSMFVFMTGGDCVSTPCVVVVDTNAMDVPNQMGQDRAEIKIKRDDANSCPTVEQN